MPELTDLQACSEVYDLWTGIAREAEKERHREKGEIPGPWQKYLYCCPCCQYILNREVSLFLFNCTSCPMAPEWKSFVSLDSDNPAENYFCETYVTPYLKWLGGPRHYSCYDLAFFAYLIADLSFEAMERIKKEEEAS